MSGQIMLTPNVEEVDPLDSSVSKDELIRATINVDIAQALRKFANKNIMLVAKALHLKGSLTFAELQKETGLSTNIQNHTLHEMKKVNLVIQVDKRYYLTKYCALLLDAINRLRAEVKSNSFEEGGLFDPVIASSRI